MIIERHNLVGRLVQATAEERRWLATYLTFPNKASYFSGGPAEICIYDHISSTFPAGWIPLLRKAATAPDVGVEVELRDMRTRPCAQDDTADLAWLRDDQRTAVDTCIRIGRGIVSMATGGGKTEVAIALVQALPCRWVFLVGDMSLLNQTAERYFKRTGEAAGVVGDGNWSEGRFTVASYDTLYRRLKGGRAEAFDLLRGAQGIICDECHELPAATNFKVAQSTPNAYFRFGLSGTPLDRTDRRSQAAIGVLGPLIVKVTAKELIDKGLLSPPRIVMVECDQHSLRPTWQGAKSQSIVNSKERNNLLVDIARRAEKPGLLFVEAIKHGQLVKKLLEKAGLNVDFVWGAADGDLRAQKAKWLMQGKLDLLISSRIFNQGIDLPDLRSIIVGGGGKSTIEILQRIGRGMRTAPGKEHFEVWDILDTGVLWTENHAKLRLKAYKGQGYAVRIERSATPDLVP